MAFFRITLRRFSYLTLRKSRLKNHIHDCGSLRLKDPQGPHIGRLWGFKTLQNLGIEFLHNGYLDPLGDPHGYESYH